MQTLETSSNNSDVGKAVDLLVSRVPDNETCEFPFQKLSSIEHENDCRFVNPAYTHPRGTIHPLSSDRDILYPLTQYE